MADLEEVTQVFIHGSIYYYVNNTKSWHGKTPASWIISFKFILVQQISRVINACHIERLPL